MIRGVDDVKQLPMVADPQVAYLIKRGNVYYIKHYVNGRKVRITTGTDQYQLAKKKLHRFEDAQRQGRKIFFRRLACVPWRQFWRAAWIMAFSRRKSSAQIRMLLLIGFSFLRLVGDRLRWPAGKDGIEIEKGLDPRHLGATALRFGDFPGSFYDVFLRHWIPPAAARR